MCCHITWLHEGSTNIFKMLFLSSLLHDKIILVLFIKWEKENDPQFFFLLRQKVKVHFIINVGLYEECVNRVMRRLDEIMEQR